jgi:5-formyltetrahydrofolate cyclo-ligase
VKKETRQELRKIIAAIPKEELRERSISACNILCEQPEYRKAEIIMTFLSLPMEIDTSPIVLRSWLERKRVLAPKVSWEQRRMLPLELTSLTQDILENSPLGLREPASGPPFPLSAIDLVIVPGLGFDEFGNRLGRGQGFYDNFLSHKEWKGIACGLAFHEQFLPSVPAGPHDMQVDLLVTDQGVYRFGR